MFDVPTPTHQLTQSRLEQVWRDASVYHQKIYTQKRPHASQAGFCHRRSAMHGMLPEVWTEMSGSLPYYAEIGKGVERVALRKYDKIGVLVRGSFKLPEELFQGFFNLGGEVDAVLQIDGIEAIYDIKTTGIVKASDYVELTTIMREHLAQHHGIIIEREDDEESSSKCDTLPTHQVKIRSNSAKKPYPSYLAQVQVYCAVTGFNDGWLQFISRRVQDTYDRYDDSPSTSFYAVPLDEETLTRKIAMIIYGEMCRDNRVIPAIPNGVKKSHCSNAFCPFQEFCHDNVNLYDLHNYGKHQSVRDIKMIDVEDSQKWRAEALDKAKQYMSKRSERANMTREILGLPRV